MHEEESKDAGMPPESEGASAGGEAAKERVEDLEKEALEGPLEAEVSQLRQEVSRLRQELSDLNDRYLRAIADFENSRRRMRRQLEEATLSASEALIKRLLPVVDNLERTVQASGSVSDVASLQRGVEMILDQFRAILAELGVSEIAAENELFDPTKHEALEQIEAADEPDGKVVAVLQKGYVFRDRLLRPSLVRVARQ